MLRTDDLLLSNDVKETRAGWLVALATLAFTTLMAPHLAGCRGAVESGEELGYLTPPSENPECVSSAVWPGLLPDITPRERELETWLARYPDAAEVLMEPAEIARHNAALRSAATEEDRMVVDILAPSDAQSLVQELSNRLSWMQEQLRSGRYLNEQGERVDYATFARLEAPTSVSLDEHLHLATESIPVRCAPVLDGFYTFALDPAFDRNNCSSIRTQEVVRVLSRQWEGLLLVRTRYTLGWIAADAGLTPALDVETVRGLQDAGGYEVVADGGLTLRAGDSELHFEEHARLYAAPPNDNAGGDGEREAQEALATLRVGTGSGLVDVSAPRQGLRAVPESFTRENLLRVAFSYLDEPYGWGGYEDGRDCSRFIMDLFAHFGLELPRHSGVQQHAGTYSIDVSGLEEAQKQRALDLANEDGVALLHLNGHIMLYLGRDDAGEPLALHSFSEFVEPCPDGEVSISGTHETVWRVDRVDVSTLELGRGSERTSFIERLDRITVFGHRPDPSMRGVVSPRQPAPLRAEDLSGTCGDSESAALFTTPIYAHVGAPMRVILATSEDPGPIEAVALSPSGETLRLSLRASGGPPFGHFATIEEPEAGTWRLVFGEAGRVVACEEVRVRSRAYRVGGASGPVWRVRNAWSESFENLYSLWVHELFAYPLEDDRTWTNLHDVLAVEEMNFLYGYYNIDEEAQLRLQPDCADLPHVLRAYFAWKLGLPFGFRPCNRGREGRPPSCGEVTTNLMERTYEGNASEFNRFAVREVSNTVHSGGARTVPHDDETDLYPLPLTREALRPGVTFVDPDGHLLVIAGWVPQTFEDYGVLYAADAQPDGTVGRPRFWRGSFLFRPETDSVGAGFKAFRPLVLEQQDGESLLRPLSNDELRGRELYPWSDEQNEGTREDFYEAVEALINPLPLDPQAMQLALIDALETQLQRRVTSVNNGLAYMRERGWSEVEMPQGYRIFETSGAWENYSTPSRDMRLLIALDTVLNFVATVRRAPERFTLDDHAELDDQLEALVRWRDEQLASRSIRYERSDGSTWELSLLEVVQRIEAFEVSYNPNDCPEVRWAARPESDEMATCDHRAPQAQQERMESYRPWFAERRRPPR